MDKKMIDFVESVSRLKADGHFTLMKFTTGWKAMFFTPNIDESRDIIFAMPIFKTADEAVTHAIHDHLGLITEFYATPEGKNE